jgi:hypothetical protein
MEKRELRAAFPPWVEALEKPAAFVVVKGGRGAAKSWTVATMAVLKAVELKAAGPNTDPRDRFCKPQCQSQFGKPKSVPGIG